MKISTSMKIFTQEDRGGSLFAVGTVTIDDCIVLHQVKVIRDREDRNKWFLSLPRTRGKDGKWYDVIRLTKEQRKEIEEKIFHDLIQWGLSEFPFEIDMQESTAEGCIAIATLTHRATGIRIKGVQILEGGNGPFVSFPKQRMENGKYATLVDFQPALADDVRRHMFYALERLQNGRGSTEG